MTDPFCVAHVARCVLNQRKKIKSFLEINILKSMYNITATGRKEMEMSSRPFYVGQTILHRAFAY